MGRRHELGLVHLTASSRVVRACIIIVPALNMPAYRAGTRVSPIDQVNLNRVFPGDRNGTTTFAFTPANIAVVLQGTDRWREAYFELPDVKFNGVNQGPQAAARFAVNGKIFFSRVRYGVIRPCGPYAGVNPLVDCKPVSLAIAPATNGLLQLTWPAESTNFVLQSTPTLLPTQWQTVTNPAPTVEGGSKVVTITNTGTDAYYRLRSVP